MPTPPAFNFTTYLFQQFNLSFAFDDFSGTNSTVNSTSADCPAGAYNDGSCRTVWPKWVVVSVPLLCIVFFVVTLTVVFFRPDGVRVAVPTVESYCSGSVTGLGTDGSSSGRGARPKKAWYKRDGGRKGSRKTLATTENFSSQV